MTGRITSDKEPLLPRENPNRANSPNSVSSTAQEKIFTPDKSKDEGSYVPLKEKAVLVLPKGDPAIRYKGVSGPLVEPLLPPEEKE